MNPTLEEFDQVAKKIRDLRVLVIGECILDEYIEVDVERISPEAPVPIGRITNTVKCVGGAGNVAINCKRLGAKNVYFASYHGNGSEDMYYREMLENSGVNIKYLSGTPTPLTKKTRVVSKNHQLIRIDRDYEYFAIGSKPLYIAEDFDCVLIADYGKGIVGEETVKFAKSLDDYGHVPIFVDPYKGKSGTYGRVTAIIANENEFNFDDVEFCREALVKKNGSEGCSLYHSLELTKFPAININLSDSCGCGDSFFAMWSLWYTATKDINTACQVANVAGGITATHFGVYPVSIDEIREYKMRGSL